MGSTPPRPMGAPGRHYDALTARRAGAGIVESGIASAVQAALYDRHPHGSRVGAGGTFDGIRMIENTPALTPA